MEIGNTCLGYSGNPMPFETVWDTLSHVASTRGSHRPPPRAGTSSTPRVRPVEECHTVPAWVVVQRYWDTTKEGPELVCVKQTIARTVTHLGISFGVTSSSTLNAFMILLILVSPIKLILCQLNCRIDPFLGPFVLNEILVFVTGMKNYMRSICMSKMIGARCDKGTYE